MPGTSVVRHGREELGRASESARWFRFDPDIAPNEKWICELYIGVELPGAGEAWALAACDRD